MTCTCIAINHPFHEKNGCAEPPTYRGGICNSCRYYRNRVKPVTPESIEQLARQHFEPRRHFMEPADSDGVCEQCGEFADADFIRITVHYNDGDG